MEAVAAEVIAAVIRFLLRNDRLVSLRVILVLRVILLISKKLHGSNSLGKTSSVSERNTHKSSVWNPSSPELTVKISEQRW